MLANHAEKECFIRGVKEPITIKPGQFITGRFDLHHKLYPKNKKSNLSPLSIQRLMNKLKRLKNLDIETNNKYSLVTICNWPIYQSTEIENEQQGEQPHEQQMNNKRTTDEQQMNTNKNIKNDKNDKEWKEKTHYARARGYDPQEELRAKVNPIFTGTEIIPVKRQNLR